MEHSEKQVKKFKTQAKNLKFWQSHMVYLPKTQQPSEQPLKVLVTYFKTVAKVYFNKVMLEIPFGILQQSPCQHNVFLISVTFLTMYHRR